MTYIFRALVEFHALQEASSALGVVKDFESGYSKPPGFCYYCRKDEAKLQSMSCYDLPISKYSSAVDAQSDRLPGLASL